MKRIINIFKHATSNPNDATNRQLEMLTEDSIKKLEDGLEDCIVSYRVKKMALDNEIQQCIKSSPTGDAEACIKDRIERYVNLKANYRTECANNAMLAFQLRNERLATDTDIQVLNHERRSKLV